MLAQRQCSALQGLRQRWQAAVFSQAGRASSTASLQPHLGILAVPRSA